jgi:hypothetical protein
MVAMGLAVTAIFGFLPRSCALRRLERLPRIPSLLDTIFHCGKSREQEISVAQPSLPAKSPDRLLRSAGTRCIALIERTRLALVGPFG